MLVENRLQAILAWERVFRLQFCVVSDIGLRKLHGCVCWYVTKRANHKAQDQQRRNMWQCQACLTTYWMGVYMFFIISSLTDAQDVKKILLLVQRYFILAKKNPEIGFTLQTHETVRIVEKWYIRHLYANTYISRPYSWLHVSRTRFWNYFSLFFRVPRLACNAKLYPLVERYRVFIPNSKGRISRYSSTSPTKRSMRVPTMSLPYFSKYDRT